MSFLILSDLRIYAYEKNRIEHFLDTNIFLVVTQINIQHV